MLLSVKPKRRQASSKGETMANKETMINENEVATTEEHDRFELPNGNGFFLSSLLDGTFAPHGVFEWDYKAEDIVTFRHFENLEDAREVFEAVRTAYEVIAKAGVQMVVRWEENEDDLTSLSNSTCANELAV